MFRTFKETRAPGRLSLLVGWVGALAITALAFQAIYTMLGEWE
jgi:hypothetical protein